MRSVILAIIVCFLWSFPANAGEVLGYDLQSISEKQVKIRFNAKEIHEDDVSIFEIPGAKPRIVVDIDNGSSDLLNKGVFKASSDGLIAGIRGAQKDPKNIRFVVDLHEGSQLVSQKISASAIEITLEIPSQEQNVTDSSAQQVATVTTDNVPIPRIKPAAPRRPVIVIDAGHGGSDPGAVGRSGLKEKSVTLKAAQELKTLLHATGRYKVVLSRSSDKYVDHEARLRVARANGADLFISVHADATEGTSARGASVYTLADRAKNRSKRIVNSQNWIMDVDLSQQNEAVGNILVDLAQRNTLSQSTIFADILIAKLGKTTTLLRNTHRRAGYYVLLAPDVPAVLLELGFISNAQDEKLLQSKSHRQKVMRSVVSAINRYFDTQNP